MTLNGAIMQLVEMRENSMMPVVFKPYFDKVIETISECVEPSEIPHWIPCSERLPEEEGWYITTIENEKTGRRRIENDLFAIGIAEAHGNTPYKFCKDGYRQKTIAWMPLPEPYREGD